MLKYCIKGGVFLNLFKSKAENELDSLSFEIKINLQNNYKSLAHEARKKLALRTESLFSEDRINEKVYNKYIRIYNAYTEKMKDYHD